MHSAAYVMLSVCPSICHICVFVYRLILKRFLLSFLVARRPTVLVFRTKYYDEIQTGTMQMRYKNRDFYTAAALTRSEFRNFLAICRSISEAIQDRAIITVEFQ